jgi:AcrR family transcriptional regulator
MTRTSGVLILQAVRDLVEERGSVAFTFEEVAKRARVSRQTVYTHFPDRASLLVALADLERGRPRGPDRTGRARRDGRLPHGFHHAHP